VLCCLTVYLGITPNPETLLTPPNSKSRKIHWYLRFSHSCSSSCSSLQFYNHREAGVPANIPPYREDREGTVLTAINRLTFRDLTQDNCMHTSAKNRSEPRLEPHTCEKVLCRHRREALIIPIRGDAHTNTILLILSIIYLLIIPIAACDVIGDRHDNAA